jgi:predicted ester cyclase
MSQLVEKYITALGTNDAELLDELYDENVVLYSPFSWELRGRAHVKGFVAAMHQAYPGLGVTLHDEFASEDGSRVSVRFTIHWHNTGSFMGNEPTGTSGTASEVHTFRVAAGRIVEQFAAHNTLGLTRLQLNTFGLPLPEKTADPAPALLVAGDEVAVGVEQ